MKRLFLILMLVLTSVSGVSSQTEPDLVLSQIAFVSDRDGNYELYLMNPDGSNVQRLTDNEAAEFAPDWSPDGNKIAFGSDRDGDSEIYIMAADGRDVKQITDNDGQDGAPVWSPDGSQIAFISDRNGSRSLFVMDSTGENVRQLTTHDETWWEDLSPVWLNEDQIAYGALRRTPMIMYVSENRETDANVLVDGDILGFTPNDLIPGDMSPDGQEITFTSQNPSLWSLDVFRYDLNTNDWRIVSLTTYNNSGGTWSPDGNYIAYASEQDYVHDIYSIILNDPNNPDPENLTTPAINLTNDPANDVMPDWSPPLTELVETHLAD